MTSFGALIHISMMMISWDIIAKVPKSTQKVRRILYIIAQSLIQQGMYILLTSIAAQVL